MVYDPFAQITPPEATAATDGKVVEKVVYVEKKPNLILGVEDKIIIGVLAGIIIASFLGEISHD